jgi:hypothetical protein
MTTRRSLIQCSAAILFSADAIAAPDGELAELWRQFLRVERRLDRALSLVEARLDDRARLSELLERADTVGHEHDDLVRRIAARRASSWQGVMIKLLSWRRTANLSEFKLPDADVALAFSAYLDALRLSSIEALPDDTAIARLALRDPNSSGGTR